MSEPTEREDGGAALGIGELARLTGVPVRTIRFYCDEGILEPRRSTGGHRRFAPSAVERLGLVRRLRALGLGLPAITRVLTGERSVGEAVAAERAALDVELSSLAWRRACLCAVEQAGPAERAARLDLLTAAEDGRAAHGMLVDFWRRLAVAPMPDETLAAFVSMAAPEPPAEPTPEQVVAYAELIVLARDRSLTRRMLARAHANQRQISDEAALLAGIGEACELARPLVAAGRGPGPGRALDRFVAAHASVRSERDTPRFRRALLTNVAVDRDPRMHRYWGLVGEVAREPIPVGTAHLWLLDSLELSVAPGGYAGPGGSEPDSAASARR
ncbi:MerR family transcriptional regulator [Streptomyces armeniacus]|uniref:MerR family transcriptional regulator n=1 Tax=Streptomyces armeniacus TaxID=83291 RepID=UPI001FE9F473|nr:MerR family transcriptional regulator [Streptomyces armeniacus]